MRDYPDCIQELYESGTLGEAVFVALSHAASSSEHRDKFATLAQRENEARTRLRPLLAKYGLRLAEKVEPSLIDFTVESYRTGEWKSFIEKQRDVAATLVRRFEQIERMAPPEDFATVHDVLLHQRALLSAL